MTVRTTSIPESGFGYAARNLQILQKFVCNCKRQRQNHTQLSPGLYLSMS